MNSSRFPLYAKILLWFFLNLVLIILMMVFLLNTQFQFTLDWLLTSSGAKERMNAAKNLVLSSIQNRPQKDWTGILKNFDNAYHSNFLVFDRFGIQIAGEPTKLPNEVSSRFASPLPTKLQSLTFASNYLGMTTMQWSVTNIESQVYVVANSPQVTNRIPILTPPSVAVTVDGLPTIFPQLSQGLPNGSPTFSYSPLLTNRTGLNLPPSNTTVSSTMTPSQLQMQNRFNRASNNVFVLKTSNPDRYWSILPILINSGNSSPTRATLLISSTSFHQGGLLFNYTPWLVLGLGTVMFSALFWFPIIRGITKTIAQISNVTHRVADGHFDDRVKTHRRDELGSLGLSVNHMAERLDGFVKGQKRFLGDIAHELCSPIARLQLALGILEENATDPQKRYLQSATDNARQMAELVSELLSFSKASLNKTPPKEVPVSLLETLEKAIHRESTDPSQIQIEVPPDLIALADPNLILRGLCNIIRNAILYAGHAGPIVIRGVRTAEGITLDISDSGPGVREEDLMKIFDPFFRGDTSRDRTTGGVGLGLTIVKTCIESCKGSIQASNLKPHGLKISIALRAA